MNKQGSCFSPYVSYPVTLYSVVAARYTCWNQSNWILWHARKILTEAIGLRGSTHFHLKSDRRSQLMRKMRFLTWMFVSFLSQTTVTSSTKGKRSELCHLTRLEFSMVFTWNLHHIFLVKWSWGHWPNSYLQLRECSTLHQPIQFFLTVVLPKSPYMRRTAFKILSIGVL